MYKGVLGCFVLWHELFVKYNVGSPTVKDSFDDTNEETCDTPLLMQFIYTYDEDKEQKQDQEEEEQQQQEEVFFLFPSLFLFPTIATIC